MLLMSEILAGNFRLEEAARGGPSIKARPVKEDADAVCRIQTALAYLSYVMPKSFPNGPFSDPDGIFGQETEDIVRVFQQTNFLNQPREWDGRVGAKTLTKLDVLLPGRGVVSGKGPPPIGKKRILVKTGNQTLQAFAGTRTVFDVDCVTGDSSHPTTAGTFSIFRKVHPCRSIKYNVQMNFAMFFTVDGKAIHQYHGIMPLAIVRLAKSGTDWFGSHGCVRLTRGNASSLFNWTPQFTQVKVI